MSLAWLSRHHHEQTRTELKAMNGQQSRERNDNVRSHEYSLFSPLQKTCILYLASFSAMFSGLSSFIYYPSITAISSSLGVTIQLVNLTITSYQIVSGIAPAILGDFADQAGRRPVLLIALTLYSVANLALACQNSYAALLILRCLQSAGASSTIAIAYGFIADIAPPSERGSSVGILQGFTNSAPSIGPVLGGVLTEKLSWHWVFWILTILSSCHLLIVMFLMPETSRKLIGDGRIEPSRTINKTILAFLRPKIPSSLRKVSKDVPKLRVPNLLSCLRTLLQKASFLVILVGGIQYTIYGCLATSLSTLMIKMYDLNSLTGGLVYLPSGLGGILAAYTTGRILDKDYRTTARVHGLPEDKSSNDLTQFPIEKARLLSVFPMLAVSTAATAGYGWSLTTRVHIAVPLVLTFFTGASQVAIFTVCGTLLTDLNCDQSATIQASYSLVRCALSAAGIAALQAMLDAVGVGWCFSIFAVVGAACAPVFILLRYRGLEWRRAKMISRTPEDTSVPVRQVQTTAV